MRNQLILILSFFCISSFSQPEWELIHGTDASFTISDITMTDTSHTWGISGGSVYLSPDRGITWDLQFQNPDFHFNDLNFLDSLTGWVVGWSEVMKTDDGGQTWTQQFLPNPLGLDVEAVFFLNQDTGWIAGSYKTIYATTDGGETWKSQHDYELSNHYFLRDIHFYDALHGCAVGGGMQSNQPIVMTTSDGGNTWIESLPENDHELINVQFLSESRVWAIDNGGTLFRSSDGGFSFEEYLHWVILNSRQMHFFDSSKAIISSSFRQVITQDGWQTYDTVEFGLYNAIGSFAYCDDNHGSAVGQDNFLLTNDGGFNWSRINERFYRISFFDPMNGWIIQEPMNKKLMHSTDGGVTWAEVETGHSGFLYEMSFPTNTTGYVLSTNAQLLKTSDAGTSWDIIQLPGMIEYFNDMQFLDENTGFLCARPDKIYKTVNGGQDWEEIKFLIPGLVTDIYFIDELEGWLVGYDSICGHTTDGGYSWHYVNLPSGNLSEITFIDHKTGFINSMNHKIFRSSDGGMNWEELDMFLSYPNTIAFSDSLNGWLSDLQRLYRTLDAGMTWVEYMDIQNSKWREEITDIFLLDSCNGWFSTMDGRVFSLSLELGNEEITSHESIHIFPNPVIINLTIDLADDLRGDFLIRIFSSDGKLLMNREYFSFKGSSISLDLSTLASGLYFLQVQDENGSQSFKILKQ